MKTLREYIEDNVEDVVAELCQYQNCDNCSIGSLYKNNNCKLHTMTIEEAVDEEIEVEDD